MDGHFDSNDRFSGTGDDDEFHGHSHCSAHHFDFDFSVMHAQQTANEAARLSAAAGGAYESHDDLCVDRCMGVGLYNGFQQFNHRGAPPSLQNRWPRDSQHFPMGLNDLSMQYRAADIAPPAANLYQQSWYTHQIDPCVPCADEDCHSMADSCCDSECTMTDKCTDVACADTEDACTDQTCPERSAVPVPGPGPVPVPTSEVVSGAAALISINHAPEDSQHQYDMQDQVMGDLGFGLSSPHQQPYLLPPDFLPGQLGNITNHLLVAHGDTSSSHCTDSCPLDDPQIYQYCHMPLPSNPAAFGQFNPVDSTFQMNQSFVECGAEIHDAESFLMHFNAQHRPYFTTGMPNLLRGSAGARHNGHVLASTEVMSPPATPLDTSDSGRSSATPSPLTPLSNSVEMTDAEPDSSLHLRSISTASSVDPSLELAAEEEHRCLWRDEGSSSICGLLFDDSEELFKHASETHIKHAQKGVQGFRCGWDDCPRSEAGATGFPQRSKIERHMQTHIGHKPHICPTCNKGFSAKQALTQHMFIHSNEKPLVCNICHKAFRYPSALTMHQRVHSGLKPLKCPVCGKGFSESSNLSKHKRTHEVKGRFTCTVPGCDRNFHRQDQLRRHMKTHQKEGDGRPMSSSAASVDCMFDQSPQS